MNQQTSSHTKATPHHRRLLSIVSTYLRTPYPEKKKKKKKKIQINFGNKEQAGWVTAVAADCELKNVLLACIFWGAFLYKRAVHDGENALSSPLPVNFSLHTRAHGSLGSPDITEGIAPVVPRRPF